MTNEELVKNIQSGINTTQCMEQLYLNNKPIIAKIANKYTGVAEHQDLMQEAYFGLCEAVKRFEDTKETKFMSYAGIWIKQSIQRYIENNGRTVRLPVHTATLMNKYRKVINYYRAHYNRKPDKEELRKSLRINLKTLESLEVAIHQFNNMDSLDRQIASEDDDTSLMDSIQDSNNVENDIIENLMQNKIQTELWEIVKENTTEEENTVINYRFKDDLTLSQTGEAIGKTTEMARNIEGKALRNLRRSKCSKRIREQFEINLQSAYRSSLSNFNRTWTSSTEYAALRNIDLEISMSCSNEFSRLNSELSN